MWFSSSKNELIGSDQALPGRSDYGYEVPDRHAVSGHPIRRPFPDGLRTAVFGLGCFWGAEEIFWQLPGVWSTAVGYTGGFTPFPSYEEVCTGRTGHTEAILVVFDPRVCSYAGLLAQFFEVHDPTQGMRQGNDLGSQYRSAIYLTEESQRPIAERARAVYAAQLDQLGYGPITTEIVPAAEFYYAEDYHQQYLAKNPDGYRCHAAAGVPFARDQLAATG